MASRNSKTKRPGQFEGTYNSRLFARRQKARHMVFIGTACTGLVRMEWAQSRFCQVIPTNWGYQSAVAWVPAVAPMGYLVADAQNVIVRHFMDKPGIDWLLLVEEDNCLPPDAFLRFNDYIRSEAHPIVSALYFTKSVPAEPMVYRGRANSYYTDWKIGDLVWCDAVPTGVLLIHRSVIEALWAESEPYIAGAGCETRKVFVTPESTWHDPEIGVDNAVGTSDMEFCSRIIETGILEKAGWPKHAKMDYPFLVDTNILSLQIDQGGRLYPSKPEIEFWQTAPAKRPNDGLGGYHVRRSAEPWHLPSPRSLFFGPGESAADGERIPGWPAAADNGAGRSRKRRRSRRQRS